MAGLLEFLMPRQSQDPWSGMRQTGPMGGGMGDGFLSQLLAPEVALPMAAQLLGNQGNAANFGNAFGAAGQAIGEQKKLKAQTRQSNKTIEMLQADAPDIAQGIEMGALTAGEGYKMYLERRKAQAPDFKVVGNNIFNTADQSWIQAPGGGGDYSQRERAAQQFGLTPDNPAYQSFILTGKMPREDAQPLTATDKKAILEADEMVAANENAIRALDQAGQISDQANAGWGAGTRAAIGNNLPDWMVPDAISSPESSVATTDMDNAVIGQALASLKTIFGGNPTEGERAILLQLQGSSSMPREVRQRVFARAKELAMRRLEFNRQRAEELRGGGYYKPGGAPQSSGSGNRTSSGVEWSIEP